MLLSVTCAGFLYATPATWNIRFTNSQEASFLIYGTNGVPPIWRVAYPDPENPSKRLIKAVRVTHKRLPESIRNLESSGLRLMSLL